MKTQKLLKALLAVFIISLGMNAAGQQPNWEVNPYDFLYSMTIQGKVTTDGYFSDDSNDMIAAFIGDTICGVANVKYRTSTADYRVFILVYGNDPSKTITFKIYDASKNEVIDAKQTINFTANDILGTANEPFIFSASSLNSGAQLLNFSIPNQEGTTIISGNTVFLQQHWSGNLSAITPEFTLSDGATAWINGVEQTSGNTVNDFTSPLEYEIISADQSATSKYTVEVTTANDIPTGITLSENKKQENDALTFVGYFTVLTANPNETHVLSLVNAPDVDNEFFYISGTGLRARNSFNFEEKSSYRIFVRADDEKGGVVEKYFTINILDINDPPSNIALTNTNTPANAPPNTVIGELIAIDEDANDTHTFSIIDGNGVNDSDNGKFYIENNLLKCNETLAFLEGNTYKVRIKVEDSGQESAVVDFELSTKDQGNPPYNLTLSNTQVIGTDNPPILVGFLGTQDIDQEEGHVFTLLADTVLGIDNDYFSINNKGLYLTNPLPVNEKNSYSIMVAVKDSMNNQFSRHFSIQVRESLNTQQFVLSNNQLPENQPNNTIIGHFQTTDNPDRNGYSYSLPLDVDLSTFSNDKFKVSGRTLLSNQVFDFENNENLKVKVEVFDGEDLTEQEVPIIITDKNDAPSNIKLSTLTLSESATVNSVVATISASDQDANDAHNFSLVIGNGMNDESNNIFRIDGNNLVLSKALNFEEKEYHNILIRVADKEEATFEQAFRIQIANANDAPEIVSEPVGYIFQNESFAYQIKAIDSENDNITIHIVGLPTWLTFLSGSNIITGVAANENVGMCNFSITASDGNKESMQEIVLTVIDVNDAPEINYYLEPQIMYINRDNTIQIPFDCIIDPDVNDVLSYNLSQENNSALPAWLIFDAVNLTLKGNPPHDARGIHRFKLTATDKGKLKEWMVFELEVSFATSVNVDEASTFKVYPNPANNNLNFVVPNGNEKATIRLTNIAGQTVETFEFAGGTRNSISISDINPGVYFITFRQSEHQQIEKLVIN